MGKYSIYAVAYGRDPVTHEVVTDRKFSAWRDCLPFINEVEGANFKGFLNETDANNWLVRQHGMPRAHKPVQSSLTADPMYKPYASCPPAASPPTMDMFPSSHRSVSQVRSNDSMKAAETESGRSEIRLRFSEKCMNLGLNPNSVLYYLMTQWCNNMEDFGFVKAAQLEEEDEDEVPW